MVRVDVDSVYNQLFAITKVAMANKYTQRRVQPDQCYFTVQITGSNFECS